MRAHAIMQVQHAIMHAQCKHNMPTCVHMPSCKHNMASWMHNNVDAGIMGQRVCYGSTYDFHCSLENFQTMFI